MNSTRLGYYALNIMAVLLAVAVAHSDSEASTERWK